MGRSGSFTKTTSGGSASGRPHISTNQLEGRAGRLHRAGQKEHTDGIRRAEPELEPVCLVLVERIAIEHLDIQEPFLEIVGRNQLDPRRQRIGDLETHLSAPRASGPDKTSQTFWSSLPSLFAANCAPMLSGGFCCLLRKRQAANVSKWRDERVTRRGREPSSSLGCGRSRIWRNSARRAKESRPNAVCCGRVTGTLLGLNTLWHAWAISRRGQVALMSSVDAGVQCLLGGVKPRSRFRGCRMQGPTAAEHLTLPEITATQHPSRRTVCTVYIHAIRTGAISRNSSLF